MIYFFYLETGNFYPQVDAALIATGRAPFTKGLGLENVSTWERLPS